MQKMTDADVFGCDICDRLKGKTKEERIELMSEVVQGNHNERVKDYKMEPRIEDWVGEQWPQGQPEKL